MLNAGELSPESIYKTLVEEASVLTALYTGPEIRIAIANKLMLAAWGKDESIIGKPIREAVPELQGQPFFDYFDKAYQTGEEHSSYEERADLLVDGVYQAFYYNFTYKPLKRADGTTWGIVHTALDVTKQVHAKKATERADEMLYMALDSAELGIWFVDAETRKLQASPRTKELFGYYPDEDMPMDAAIIQIPEEHRQRVVDAIDFAIVKRENYDIEYPVLGFHGQALRWLRVTGKLYEHEVNGSSYLTGTVLDVTHRKLNEQRKDEFISVASHELKTPLTSLMGGFQLLDRHLTKESGLSEGLLKILSSTRINLKKLSLLVEDLLNVNKIENGHLKLNKSWFIMSQLINECCDHVRLEGTHELKLSGDLNIQVYADRQKIDQVIVNLINNAIKYAPNSKIVNLHIDFDGKCVKVSVQDFGIGIPKHKLGEVFNRFYQIDSSNFQFSGLGLGLYISSQIIKQHQGKIGVESEPEQGSTFWFSIPRE